MAVGHANGTGKDNKATLERSTLIEYLGNKKFDILIVVLKFTSQEKNQKKFTSKVALESLKVE